jgi:hypothetical protein
VRLTEAAGLFRESGARWSRVAGRAGEVVAGLGDYAELAELVDEARTLEERAVGHLATA